MLHVTIPFEEKPASNLPGDNLRYYRQRKSLTTRQLAEQIDVVPATILMYEQNKHPIPFDVANGLADALDVNADLLYDDFAVFLVTPYSEALKDIRMSIGMSQRTFSQPTSETAGDHTRGRPMFSAMSLKTAFTTTGITITPSFSKTALMRLPGRLRNI